MNVTSMFIKHNKVKHENMDIGDFLLEAENMANFIKRRCKVFMALKYDESQNLIPDCELEVELADSKIMIEQIAHVLGLEDKVTSIEDGKLNRLSDRIDLAKEDQHNS